MTVSLWRAFLVLLVVRQSIIARVNLILETCCKGALGKKGDKISVGDAEKLNACSQTWPVMWESQRQLVSICHNKNCDKAIELF